MNILLISRCPPYPLHLGDRLILYHLSRELRARGHTLDLLAFTNRAEDAGEQAHYAHFFDHVELFPEPRRTMARYLRRQVQSSRRFPRRAGDAWSAEMWRAIERRLTAKSYDVAHMFGGVQVYEYAHAVGDVPALITPYESYSLYLSRAIATAATGMQRVMALAQWALARNFESWMFAPYARTVVVSGQDRDELTTLNPALRVDVIPNGIDLSAFVPQAVEREAARLLFTGNYEYAPNVDAALRLAKEILPQVRAQVPDATLWLVGHAPPDELLALKSDTIEVTGRVPEVQPYLARATVFVSPLRLGAGIKNKVLEALAMGCPVVATPLSLDGIAVKDGRDVLAAEDSEIASKVVQLLRDPTLQQTLAHNGRALIEAHYTWGRVAALYEQLYQSISNAGA